MIGADSLVPPNWDHEEFLAVVGRVDAQTAGVGVGRGGHVCHGSLGAPGVELAAAGSAALSVEQPEPAPLHTVSLTRVVPDIVSDVPPTAVTYDEEAG